MKWLFPDKTTTVEPKAPEIIGLRLNGAFELDPLQLQLLEVDMVIEGVASSQLIEAVGQVDLDQQSRILRFYTDDDAFLQVVTAGGNSPEHIVDVKLWHFYETRSVSSDKDWNILVNDTISKPSWLLEGKEFLREWEDVCGNCPPVAMTETTFNGTTQQQQTDQFSMLYQRRCDEFRNEYLLACGEETFVDGQPQRCLVVSTGMDISQANIRIIG